MDANKENVSPVRTPLQDITNPYALATDRHLKKAMYEPATPSSKPYKTTTSSLKTHSITVKQQEQYEDLLMEKDRKIAELIARLQQEKYTPNCPKVNTHSDNNPEAVIKNFTNEDNCLLQEPFSEQSVELVQANTGSNSFGGNLSHSPNKDSKANHHLIDVNRLSIDELDEMTELDRDNCSEDEITSHALVNIKTTDTSTPHSLYQRATSELASSNVEYVSYVSPLKLCPIAFSSPPPSKTHSPYVSLMKKTPLGRRLISDPHSSSILNKSSHFLKTFEKTPPTADDLNAFYSSLRQRTNIHSATDCNVSLHSVDDLEFDVSLDMSVKHVSSLLLGNNSCNSPVGVISLAAELHSANSSPCHANEFPASLNNQSPKTTCENSSPSLSNQLNINDPPKSDCESLMSEPIVEGPSGNSETNLNSCPPRSTAIKLETHHCHSMPVSTASPHTYSPQQLNGTACDINCDSGSLFHNAVNQETLESKCIPSDGVQPSLGDGNDRQFTSHENTDVENSPDISTSDGLKIHKQPDSKALGDSIHFPLNKSHSGDCFETIDRQDSALENEGFIDNSLDDGVRIKNEEDEKVICVHNDSNTAINVVEQVENLECETNDENEVVRETCENYIQQLDLDHENNNVNNTIHISGDSTFAPAVREDGENVNPSEQINSHTQKTSDSSISSAFVNSEKIHSDVPIEYSENVATGYTKEVHENLEHESCAGSHCLLNSDHNTPIVGMRKSPNFSQISPQSMYSHDSTAKLTNPERELVEVADKHQNSSTANVDAFEQHSSLMKDDKSTDIRTENITSDSSIQVESVADESHDIEDKLIYALDSTTQRATQPIEYTDTPKTSRLSSTHKYRTVLAEDMSCSPFDFGIEYQNTMTQCRPDVSHANYQIQPDLIAISCSPIRYGMIDRETMTDIRTLDVKAIDIAVQVKPSMKSVFCSPATCQLTHRETMTDLRSSAVPITNSSCQACVKTKSTCSSPLKGQSCEFGTMTASACLLDTACQIEPSATDTCCSPVKFSTVNSETSTECVEQLNVSLQVQSETQSISCSPLKVMTCDSEINTDLADWVNVSATVHREKVETGCSPLKSLLFFSEDDLTKPAVCSITTQTDENKPTDVCCKCSKLENTNLTVEELQKHAGIHSDSQASQTSSTLTEDKLAMDFPKRRSEIPKFTGPKIPMKQPKRFSVDDVRKRHPIVVAQELADLMSSNNKLKNQIKFSTQEIDSLKDEMHSLKKALEEKEKTIEEHEENKEMERNLMMVELKEELEKQSYKSSFESTEETVRELQADLASYADTEDMMKETENLQNQFYQEMITTIDDLKTKSSAFEAEKAEMNSQLEMFEGCRQKLDQVEEDSKLQKAQISSLQMHNKKLAEKEEELQKEIESLECSVISITENHQLERNRAEDLEKKWNDLNTSSSEKIKRQECQIKNLMTTLDSREEDLDILEGQLFECREYITEQSSKKEELQSQLQTLQKNLEENYVEKHLHEGLNLKLSEVESLNACQDTKIKDLQNHLSLTEMERSRVEKRCAGFEEMCCNYQNEVRKLQNDLESTAEELDATKTEAQRLLMMQGSELNDCAAATHHVMGTLRKLLTTMEIKAGLQETKKDSSKTSSCAGHGQSEISECLEKSQNKANSLVSQILTAAVDPSERTSPRLSKSPVQVTQPSPATASRLSLGFSSNSAFSAVPSKVWTASSPMSAKKPLQTSAKLSLSSIESNNTSPGSLVTSPVNDGTEEISLAEQISGLNVMFEGLIRAENIIERASQLSINDLMAENKELSDRVALLSQREGRLKDKLRCNENDMSDLKKLYERELSNFNECYKKLSILKNQDAVIEKLNTHVEEVTLRMKSLEAENKILHEQMEGVVKKMELQPGELSSVQAKYEREMLVLKKKLNYVKTKLMDQEGNFIKIGEKTTRRIRILEENWNKSKNEVQQFDELVQNIQLILFQNNELVEKHEDLAKILNLISGENSPRNTSDSKALPPVKTARW